MCFFIFSSFQFNCFLKIMIDSSVRSSSEVNPSHLGTTKRDGVRKTQVLILLFNHGTTVT
ncbi:unnamed protein product [Arabidopsis halleri]